MDLVSATWADFSTDVLLLIMVVFYLVTNYIDWSEQYQTTVMAKWPNGSKYTIVVLAILAVILFVAAFVLYP